RWPIQIDPCPLRADSSVWTVTPPSRAAVSAEFLAERVSALQSRQVSTADAVIPPHCASVLEPPDPKVDFKSGCPKQQWNIVAISLPRSESADASVDSVAIVRVLETALGPFGFS